MIRAMNTLLLLVLALMPGFLFLFFILYMDKYDREPFGQVLKIVLLGALSVVPTALIEIGLGYLPIYSGGVIYKAIMIAFVQVAWVEELMKLGVVLLFVWNSKTFNEENDGIVYVGASALGFAMLENISYVLKLGMTTGVLRAITAMPLHCFTGVIMGYYVGLAKFSPDKQHQRNHIFKGFFLAYIIHGVYDALLLTQTPAGILIFPIVIGLFIFGIKFLRKGREFSRVRFAAAEVQTEVGSEGIITSSGIAAPAPPTASSQSILIQTNPTNQLWKIIISRTLLTLSGLMWVLVALGFILRVEPYMEQGFEVLLGGILLSAFPITLGVALELSYRKKKQVFEEVSKEVLKQPDLKTSPGPGPGKLIVVAPSGLAASPPGQLWRALLGRSLLIISLLFWTIVILMSLSNMPEVKKMLGPFLATTWIITIFPVLTGTLLEDSYRKRKRRYNELMRQYPAHLIPADKLNISPPGQIWKIIISRFLFGLTVVFWSMLVMVYSLTNQLDTTLGMVMLSGILFSSTPVLAAILLERSFQKQKRAYNEALKPEVTLHDEELRSYAQQLKEKRIKKIWS
jgi:protease PrsW